MTVDANLTDRHSRQVPFTFIRTHFLPYAWKYNRVKLAYLQGMRVNKSIWLGTASSAPYFLPSFLMQLMGPFNPMPCSSPLKPSVCKSRRPGDAPGYASRHPGLPSLLGGEGVNLENQTGEIDIRLAIPAWGNPAAGIDLQPVATLSVPHKDGPIPAEIWSCRHQGVEVYLIGGPPCRPTSQFIPMIIW
jgi:hypothetical protein